MEKKKFLFLETTTVGQFPVVTLVLVVTNMPPSGLELTTMRCE